LGDWLYRDYLLKCTWSINQVPESLHHGFPTSLIEHGQLTEISKIFRLIDHGQFSFITVFLLIWKRDRYHDRLVHKPPHQNTQGWPL
jgi:hypothetical protein